MNERDEWAVGFSDERNSTISGVVMAPVRGPRVCDRPRAGSGAGAKKKKHNTHHLIRRRSDVFSETLTTKRGHGSVKRLETAARYSPDEKRNRRGNGEERATRAGGGKIGKRRSTYVLSLRPTWGRGGTEYRWLLKAGSPNGTVPENGSGCHCALVRFRYGCCVRGECLSWTDLSIQQPS